MTTRLRLKKVFPWRSAIVNVGHFSTLVKDTRNKGFKHILLTMLRTKMHYAYAGLNLNPLRGCLAKYSCLASSRSSVSKSFGFSSSLE